MKFIAHLKEDPSQPIHFGEEVLEIPTNLSLEEVKRRLDAEGVYNPFWGIDEKTNAIGYLTRWDSITSEDKVMIEGLLQ